MGLEFPGFKFGALGSMAFGGKELSRANDLSCSLEDALDFIFLY